MSTRLQDHQDNVQGFLKDLMGSLDGMDYCLDWKPESSAWSVREVVYHLLDTPPGGVHSIISGAISGQFAEYEIWSDLTNLTPERTAADMEAMAADIQAFFNGMEEALHGAAEEDLDGKSVMVHQRTRGIDETRTVEALLVGFQRHWSDHLAQIKELRESLGFD